VRYIIDLINAAWDQDERFPNTVACITDKKSTCAVGIHNVYGTMYLTFRSTKTVKNIFQSLNFLPERKVAGYIAHCGYIGAWESLKDDLLPHLEERGNKPVVLSGHSLGGAIAGVGAIDLVSLGYNVRGLNIVGAPTFCLKEGVDFILKNVKAVNSFLNNNDYIRILFPWFSRVPTIHVGCKSDWRLSLEDHNILGENGYAINILKFTKED